MKLADLVAGLPIAEAPAGGAGGLEVRGLAYDSRRVRPGDLFVALVGRRHDGRAFARQAAERGAVAILGAGSPLPEVPVPWLATAADPRQVLGEIAGRFWGHPDRDLTVLGVTGTNGKSTVVALLAAVCEAAGLPAGRLGTLGYRFRDLAFPGERTTPEAPDLYRALAAMRDAGARAVALEVSSHALELGRVGGVGFDVACFTNLTRDHLDFHRDLEAYFAAKRRLFDQLKPSGRAVVAAGDAYGRRLLGVLPGALAFGPGAPVAVSAVVLEERGMRGVAASPRGPLAFASPLIGRFNLANLLATIACGEALGFAPEAIAAGLAAVRPLPGRMEPIERGQPFPVFIDYAHTDAALEAALRSLREVAGGRRLAVVFGCGGDRDPGKRPLMGRVAGELADLPILTSDNPRSEDPLAIIAAVEEGLRVSGNASYRVVPDRREAIHRALRVADAGWAVLIAGKGHEEVQIVGERTLPFSDRREAEAALEERFGQATSR